MKNMKKVMGTFWMSKKINEFLDIMKALNNDELKRLANEVEAEIQFREYDLLCDDFSKSYYKSTEGEKNV